MTMVSLMMQVHSDCTCPAVHPCDRRQTVLNKLAGEHVALAAAAQSPQLEPTTAAADLQLR